MSMKVMCTIAVALALVGAGLRPGPAASEERCVPPPGGAIDEFAGRLKVGRPKKHGNLTLYPVFADGVAVPEVGLTLDEAMERGSIEIRELKPAEVNRVRLVSTAKEPIFVMGGEMLTGAKQDRIMGDDMIVPPGADLTVPVFCVEHGRWVAKSDSFKSAAFVATSEVRKARAAADQSAVWNQVAAEQERMEAPSESGALRSIQDSEEVQGRMQPYRRALSDFPKDIGKARGVVACVGDEIVAADLFGSRALFMQLWPRLLDSYVVDAVGRESGGAAPDAVRVRRWLDGVSRAEREVKKTPGNGTLYQLSGDGLIGSALIYDGGVVHMELFAKETAEPVPFNRLDFRRERLEEGQQELPER